MKKFLAICAALFLFATATASAQSLPPPAIAAKSWLLLDTNSGQILGSHDPDMRMSQWGVGVQLPLLDQRSGPMAEAQAAIERSRIRLEGRQVELRQQILMAWKALDMARLRVEALSQGVLREAEAALRVAEAAYRFGERGILDVLDAQRVLRSVRADLLQARYQQQTARIALDQLSGQFVMDSQN